MVQDNNRYATPQINMDNYGLPPIDLDFGGASTNTSPVSMDLPSFDNLGLGNNQNSLINPDTVNLLETSTSGENGGWMDSIRNSGFMKLMFGGENADGDKTNGLASPLIGLGSSLMNGWMGMEKLGLMEDQLALQKSALDKNYKNKRSLTNTFMRDRQDMRGDRRGVNNTDDYMNKNRLV